MPVIEKATVSPFPLGRNSVQNDMLDIHHSVGQNLEIVSDPLPRLKIYSPFYSFIHSSTKADFCFSGFKYVRRTQFPLDSPFLDRLKRKKTDNISKEFLGVDLDPRLWVKSKGNIDYWVNLVSGRSVWVLPPSVAQARENHQNATSPRFVISPRASSPRRLSLLSPRSHWQGSVPRQLSPSPLNQSKAHSPREPVSICIDISLSSEGDNVCGTGEIESINKCSEPHSPIPSNTISTSTVSPPIVSAILLPPRSLS